MGFVRCGWSAYVTTEAQSEHRLQRRTMKLAIATSRMQFDYYMQTLRKRCYDKEPVRTIWRGCSYIILSKLGLPSTFAVPFGNKSFRMRLSSAKRKYGIAGIYVQRQYYESLLEFGYKLLNSGDGVVDGGANQGIYTCAFGAWVGQTGRIYAFEPLDYAIAALRANVRLNDLGNVTIFEGALSDRPGVTFIDVTNGPVSASIVYDFGHKRGTEVTTYAIDNLRDQGKISRIHFMKLDVEGAEMMTLTGAEKAIREDRPRICVEATNEALYGQVNLFLSNLGYSAYVFDLHGNLQRFQSYKPTPDVYFLT